MKLIVTKNLTDKKICSFLLDDKDCIIEMHVDDHHKKVALGGVYVGRVEQVKHNINSAFVRISEEEKVFVSLNKTGRPFYIKKNGKGDHLVQSDEILVQIEKEAHKTKQAKATLDISLPGKFSILTTDKSGVFVSSKIKNDATRLELKHTLKPYIKDGIGCIVRTNGEDVPTDMVVDEFLQLIELYENMKENLAYKALYQCLYKPSENYGSMLRDCNPSDLDEVICDDKAIVDSMKENKSLISTLTQVPLSFSEEDLNLKYGLADKMTKLKQKKVWLKSGASLIIEPTEALTVIDVNTEKSLSRKSSEETILNTNVEAAFEAMKQIRSRNISGIVIIDFIDMKDRKDERKLIKILEKIAANDRLKVTIHGMTKLGLAEISRKKVEKSIYELDL